MINCHPYCKCKKNMTADGQLANYIDGEWRRSSSDEYLDVTNPATAKVIARVPISPSAEVDEARVRLLRLSSPGGEPRSPSVFNISSS